MLKPYEAKLTLIKEEILKIGADVIDSLELSLNALTQKNIGDLKNVEITEKKLQIKSTWNFTFRRSTTKIMYC